MIEEDVIIKYDITLREVYMKKAEKDGWLYIKLSIENWNQQGELRPEKGIDKYSDAKIIKFKKTWILFFTD